MWTDCEDDIFEDFADTGAISTERIQQDSSVVELRLIANCSQVKEFHNDTQRRDRVVVHYDHDNGEVIAPSNQFERMLQCEDIEVRSDENYKKYMYIGSITSKALVTKLETNMSVHQYKEELLHSFEEALDEESNLITYLEPSHSSCGIQESIFRVLLLCRSSQVKAFDLLMTQLQILQKESRNVSDLCQICIAQIRFIDRVYYSRPLLCSIFERDILKWSPEIRNALISSIPEIITDVSIQVEAAKELQSFLLRDVETDPVGCKLAVISALLLLNFDSGAAAKMQTRVLKSLSDFDLELLPSLIELFLRRLDNSTKDAFSDLLGQLSVHLQVDQLSLSRRGKLRYSLNEIVGEVFGKITQFIVLGGEYRWRQVQKFLKTSALSEKSGADEFMSQGSDIVSSLGPPRRLTTFDVVLSIALLSVRTCPPNVSNTVKLMFTQTNENIEELCRLFAKALTLETFFELNISSTISIAQQCLWSRKQTAQQFGAKLFKALFLSLPKRRELVLKTMLSHAVYSEGESEAVLNQFMSLIDENSDSVEPFSELISGYFFILHRMTADNVKLFFRAIFRLYVNRPSLVMQKNNLNAMIPLLLHSADNMQPIFGVLASLLKLEAALLLEWSSTREEEVRCSLILLDEIRSSYTYIRPFFYSELGKILSGCFGCSRCDVMNEWLTVFIEEFRSDFFTDQYEATRELEGERYICTESNLWLKCPGGRNLGEAVPLLEAVIAAIGLQEAWLSDHTSEKTRRDRWSLVFYALNANIGMEGIENDLNSSCDVLFRTIQWIRALFNVLCDEQASSTLDNVMLDQLWTKKFLLMFECQKELISKVKSLGQWSLPDRTALSEITVVDAELKKRPRKTRKRKHDEDTEDENVVEDIVPVALTTHAPKLNEGLLGKIIPTSKLTSTLTTLKLSAVVKLLKLMQGRRRATIYLIEHLIDILAVACPRVGVKSLPWAKNETPSVRIHGDVNIILSEIEKLLPILWSTLSKTVSYFRDQLNSSAVIDTESDVAAQLTDLFRLSLITLERLFSWCHVSPLPNDPDGISRSMKVRRDKLMETIEHCILREDNERNAGSEAEHTVFDFLVDICEVVPCISVAVAVLDCVSVIRSPNEALNNKMARHALAFLKKEWTDKEGKQIKGATLIVAVRKMLSHYLHLRPINNRLCAIQWMLAKKLADLVPHDERRKSKVYEQESDDPDLNERDTNQVFSCFTRGTFATIYKVLFVAMNNALAVDVVPTSGQRRAAVEEYLRTWSIAAGCVALFGLMLRVKQLRNISLLVSAIKEGRRFLALMCNRNSSFMYLLEEKGRLAGITEQVVEIIKSVQIGNRNFQNICVHAKANRSNVLLKLVPNFRVTNEQWMRAIQSKFVDINCQDAFEIGLLKPRDINGEEIVYSGDEQSFSTCSESDLGEEAVEGQLDSDDGNTSEVY